MRKLSALVLPFVAFTVGVIAALGQTPIMLTLHVTTPDGHAVQDANVTIWPAHPVYFSFQNQNQPRPTMFATKTDAAGQAQASKADLEKNYGSGRLVLNVRATGYEPFKQSLEKMDNTKPLEIVLHPLPAKK